MLLIVVAMLLILLIAGLIVVYAAYPARGERTPYVPWLGETMEKAVEAMPTLEAEERPDWSLRR